MDVALGHSVAARQFVDVDKRGARDDDDAAVVKAAPARFVAEVVDAEPDEDEDDLEEDDDADGEQNPIERPVVGIGPDLGRSFGAREGEGVVRWENGDGGHFERLNVFVW